ncbi:MAG: hypothetical protein E7463_13115 [Ruminococcaceae bacterium]|nr:hypothetical protein [Oscillospiraceae bacterium]
MKKMNRKWRILAACILVLTVLLGFSAAAVGDTPVTVLMNGEPIDFPDNPPYYDMQAGRIYVPIRAVAENLKADVTYNPDDRTVSIERGATSILLTIDSNVALVNGVSVSLDAPAYIENGSTYVPLRFVSENLLLSVQWDAAALTVSLQPAPMVSDGMSEAELAAICGEPARRELSEKGYTWWVYDDYADYRMFGVTNGVVAARYEYNDSWVLENGLRFGMNRNDCTDLLKADKVDEYTNYCVYTTGDTAVTVYFDENAQAYAVLEELASYSERCTVTVSVLEGNARILRDLVNVGRAAEGLSVLRADEAINAVAKAHSTDMAGNNFYAHAGSDGRSSSQRVSDAGFTSFYQTQIIAKSYPNAMAAYCDHYNNTQYRTVMTADFSVLGVGVAYNANSDGLFYYTQVFFTNK